MTARKKHFYILFTLFLLMSCTAPEKVKNVEKTVPISHYLFGQNLWLTDGAEGRPGYIEASLWPVVQESGVKMIRIGGNGYDQKLPGFDTLTMWVKSIKAIGAEPMMQVSKYESAEKAASVVKHFNVDNDLRIKYWVIGNEPYLIHKVPIKEISEYIKSHSVAMRAVDPTIKILIPDEAAYVKELYEALLHDDEFGVAGRDENGNWYVDGVTFHNYPNADKYTRSMVVFNSVDKIRGMIMDMIEDIDVANEKYQRFGHDKLIWGLTEFNITYRNPADLSATGIAVPSFINGQFWADVFAMCMEYGAFTVTPWCIQESDRDETYFGYIGAPPTFTPHSTYHHMKMMADHMSGNYVKMTTNNAFVKAFGSISETLTTILLMNQSETETVEFDFSKVNKASDGLEIRANAEINASLKDSIAPNCTRIYQFDKNGVVVKAVEYTQKMAINELAPQSIL
jgi:hypothetical protein